MGTMTNALSMLQPIRGPPPKLERMSLHEDTPNLAREAKISCDGNNHPHYQQRCHILAPNFEAIEPFSYFSTPMLQTREQARDRTHYHMPCQDRDGPHYHVPCRDEDGIDYYMPH